MAELKRVFSKKLIILALMLLFANVLLFAYSQLSGRSLAKMNEENAYVSGLIEKYKDMDTAEAVELIKDDRINAGDFGKAAKAMESKLQYLEGYKASIDNILKNAENMQKFSLFSKKDSFSYNNILRTADDFKRVEGIKLNLDNDRAVDAFVNFYYIYYLAFGFMVVMIYSMFVERENGMWPIIHNSVAGRKILAAKRAVIIAVASFVVLALFYISTAVCAFAIYGGWENMGNPIQTLISFGSFSLPLSRIGYMTRLFFVSWFILAGLGEVLWMLFTVFRNRNHTLVFVAVFAGVEVLLYQKIEIQSVLAPLHHINIVSLLKINELYRGYLNWGFGTFVISVFLIILIAMAVVTVVGVGVGISRFAVMRPIGRTSKLTALTSKFIQGYQKVFSGYPVVLKEIHKLIFTSHGLWVVVVAIALSVYFSVSGIYTFTDSQKELDTAYLSDGGSEYSGITARVDEIKNGLEEAKAAAEEASVRYEVGEISMNELYSYQSTIFYMQSKLQSVSEFIQKQAYIERVSDETGVKPWMISDRGYEQIFGQYSSQRELILLLTLIICVMFIVSESVSLEYRTGMKFIIGSSKNGKGWINARKVAACVIFTLVMTSLIYGIDFIALGRIYGMPYLSAPLVSLTFMEETAKGLNLTIGGWIAIRIAVRVVIAFATMTISLSVSKLIGKRGSRALMPVALVVVIAVVMLIRSVNGGI